MSAEGLLAVLSGQLGEIKLDFKTLKLDMHSGIIKHFDGEHAKEYKKWVKGIEKWRLLHEANDAATKRVAFLTSQGPVSDFIQRFLVRNPAAMWDDMKGELKIWFADVVDGAQAFSLLKKVRQGSQNVAIYGERVQSIGESRRDWTLLRNRL